MNILKKLVIFLFSCALLEASTIEHSIQTKTDNFCAKTKSKENFCMEYKTSYPVVFSQNKHLQKQINQAIMTHLTPTNAKKYVLDYLKEMGGEVYSIGHSDENNIKVLSVTKHTFSLEISNSNYSGGAHGNYGTRFVNYDRKTGDKLSLDKLFIPKYKQELTQIAHKIYRDSNGIMPSENLVDAMDWFDNKFVLALAIGIGEKGLHLEYNPYEIRAYVYGTTSLLIPFAKLSSIVPRDSAIASLVYSDNLDHTSQTISKTFGEEGESQIRIKTTRLSQNHLKITVIIDNMSNYTKGGLSLSFPQLKSKHAVIQKKQSGFKKVFLYPQGKSIYHIGKKKVIKAKYLLAEADSKKWSKGQSKSMSLTLKVPSSLETLYLNARATFSHKKEIDTVPSYGIEGQQGFSNYRLAIPLY